MTICRYNITLHYLQMWFCIIKVSWLYSFNRMNEHLHSVTDDQTVSPNMDRSIGTCTFLLGRSESKIRSLEFNYKPICLSECLVKICNFINISGTTNFSFDFKNTQVSNVACTAKRRYHCCMESMGKWKHLYLLCSKNMAF